jgi:UDPglucose 6-dehydrogenase
MTTSVAVVGQGFVGGSLTTVLNERGCDVFTFDILGKNAKGGKTTGAFSLTEFVRMCDEINVNTFFVCLPTPMLPTGQADTSIVAGAIDEIANVPPKGHIERIVVVKSTVPPGTCSSWDSKCMLKGTRVVFSPEFLTEANAIDDMRNQDRIVLGGHVSATSRIASVFSKYFPDVPCVQMSSENAEMVKYVANCFLATKVSFANEMRQVCEGLAARGMNCNYETVIQTAKLDKRLGETHWSSPGPDGNAGFGGSCFPKDVNAMVTIAKSVGVDPKVVTSCWEKNLEVRPGRDWEKLKGRAVV